MLMLKIESLKIIDPALFNLLQQVQVTNNELFTRGQDFDKICHYPRLAIVGARSLDSEGQQIIYKIARDLAKAGVVLVSGLAMGVDSIVARAALEEKMPTIAVLASGVSKVYPALNQGLAEKIVQNNGILISEYQEGEQIHKYKFIARNQLIAAFGGAVLIGRAKQKSGSLHTARFAANLGLEVMAIPGEVNNIFASGSNELIKSGAHLITSAKDVLEVLGVKPTAPTQIEIKFNQNSILEALKEQGPKSISELHQTLGLTTQELLGKITDLEIDGFVVQNADGRWSLV